MNAPIPPGAFLPPGPPTGRPPIGPAGPAPPPPPPAGAPPGAGPAAPGGPPQPPPPPPQFHDVTVVKRKTFAKARCQGVPPEEFGIERQARSIGDCGYCFHRVIRRQSDLIAEGFDEQDVVSLPTYVVTTGVEELARDTVMENTGTGGDKGINVANRFVRIIEHYVRMDYEGEGITKLYRVVTGGEIGSIMRRNGELEIIEQDDIPFASMTPIPQPHRFYGRSLADLVMDIQRIKTALTRGLLDNVYMAVNPRPVVSEQDASESTIDDLLVSGPGRPIRGKTPNAVTWSTMPPIALQVLPTLQYMDELREWRTGIARQGAGPDPNALANQNATAANLAFTAAQAKMKLIARILAETGIRDLFSLLHETIRKHANQAQVVRLRNRWVTVDPREWKRRDDMTITVGLGSGTRQEQLAQMQALIGLQQAALQGGKTNLVSDANLYNAGMQFARLANLKHPDQFFTDPSTVPPPPPPPPDPAMAAVQAKAQNDQQNMQLKAQIELQKAQAQAELDKQKMANDFQHQQAQGLATSAQVEHRNRMDALTADREHQYRLVEMEREHQYKLAELAAREQHTASMQGMQQQHHNAMQAQDLAHQQAMQAPPQQAPKRAPQQVMRDAGGRLSGIAGADGRLIKRIVRGPDGRVSHIVEEPAQPAASSSEAPNSTPSAPRSSQHLVRGPDGKISGIADAAGRLIKRLVRGADGKVSHVEAVEEGK